MWDFFKSLGFSKVRTDFEELLTRANFISSKAQECLQPSLNVYYHYYYSCLGINRSPLEISELDIRLSLTTMQNYIKQLISLRNQIINVYKENKDALVKYRNKVCEFSEIFGSIDETVHPLIENIKSLRDYNLCPELISTLCYLEKIEQQVLPYTHSNKTNNVESIL